MTILLLPVGSDGQAYNDANGNPRSGAKLFIYKANTSTKATLYQDAAGAAQHTNPIILNSSGQVANVSGVAKSIFADSGQAYDVVLAPSTDTDPPVSPFFTLEDINVINDPTVTISEWIGGPTPTFVSTTSFTLVGDQTLIFHIGRRVKLTDATTLYGTITNSVFSSLTTITVTLDSGVLSSSLSAVSYGVISFTNSAQPVDSFERILTNRIFN